MASNQGSFCLIGSADDPELFKPDGADEDGNENKSIGELIAITCICLSPGRGEKKQINVIWETCHSKETF
jgi:hypothetical protein